MNKIENTAHSSLPTVFTVIGTFALVTAVASATLGGLNLFNTSILDPTRLSLLAGGALWR